MEMRANKHNLSLYHLLLFIFATQPKLVRLSWRFKALAFSSAIMPIGYQLLCTEA